MTLSRFLRPVLALTLVFAGTQLAVTRDYVFPISGNTDVMVWEAAHWDGRLAVDIGVHPQIPADAPRRLEFYRAEVRAVTSGVASRLDNPRGGTAVVLHADDGRTYYYAHLADAALEEPTSVAAGETLGRVGNSGTWSQFLEPHLHFSIANGHQEGLAWVADVDPVPWLERTFGRAPVPVPQTALAGVTGITYPPDEPDGLPLFSGIEITSSYDEIVAETPLLAGVTVAPRRYDPQAPDSARPVAVRSTITGVVRIHRDTPLGLRIQITNARSRFSVLISGEIEPVVATGTLIFQDDVIGFVSGPLHYTIFEDGRLAGRNRFPFD